MPLPRAEQLIDLLLARQQHPLILEKSTRLPYGWAIWLRALTPLPRPFHARDVIAVLLPRPLPGPPGRLPALGRWNAVRRLFWQDWDPAPRDQRWMRWTSALVSAALHLLFFLLLLWVAVIRTSVPDEDGAEGERVQIEFVGRGAQEGGGDQPGAESAAAAASGAATAGQPAGAATAPQPQPAAPEPSSAAATAPVASAAAPEAAPPEIEPAPLAAPPPSPVQATEVAQASSDFVVPPVALPRTEVSVVPRDSVPTVRERSVPLVQAPPTPVRTPQLAVPAPRLREVQVQEREVATVEAPKVMQPTPTNDVPVRLPQREVQVREREVQTVADPQVRMATVAGREPSVRAPSGREVQVREREVAAAPAPAASSSAGSAASATPASTGSAAQNNATTARSAATAAAAAQAGARPAPTPGNWATPARGDDWGAASRNRDGASQGAAQASQRGRGDGLFNADGSVRVAADGGPGKAERGAPGGANDGWSKERIAQSGTWLKRPPYDYTPTSFDKYWVPQESLLAEWVRKGVKAMEIPLPGTSTRISCVISILQAGGGCGLTDPNMQDQPAVARPPPDIPFKRELQEDNGSR